jgi:hypothetical protein
MAKKNVMLVLSNAVEGKEEDFNHWYSDVHLADGLKVPGFVAAQRFKLSDVQRKGVPPAQWKYLTVWEIEADDPTEALAETARRVRTPQMPVPDNTITDIWAYVYEEITPRVEPG